MTGRSRYALSTQIGRGRSQQPAELFSFPLFATAMTIHHDPKGQEFTATEEGFNVELAYARPSENLIDFTHTFVDENLRGKGLGEEMARAGLAYAREQGLKVKTSCKFMAAFVRRHEAEYADLMAQQ